MVFKGDVSGRPAREREREREIHTSVMDGGRMKSNSAQTIRQGAATWFFTLNLSTILRVCVCESHIPQQHQQQWQYTCHSVVARRVSVPAAPAAEASHAELLHIRLQLVLAQHRRPRDFVRKPSKQSAPLADAASGKLQCCDVTLTRPATHLSMSLVTVAPSLAIAAHSMAIET